MIKIYLIKAFFFLCSIILSMNLYQIWLNQQLFSLQTLTQMGLLSITLEFMLNLKVNGTTLPEPSASGQVAVSQPTNNSRYAFDGSKIGLGAVCLGYLLQMLIR